MKKWFKDSPFADLSYWVSVFYIITTLVLIQMFIGTAAAWIAIAPVVVLDILGTFLLRRLYPNRDINKMWWSGLGVFTTIVAQIIVWKRYRSLCSTE